MQSIYLKSCFLILAFLSATATTGIAHAESQSQIRSCIIQENFDSGGYTYIRCRERGRDIWLATLQTSVGLGEDITFYDCPPMVNFKNKSLDRTFAQIFFVPGISRSGAIRAGTQEGAQSSVQPRDESPPAATDNMYAGTDDNGTLVYTDDPSRAPKSAKVKRAAKKIDNTTALANFSATEQKLVSMLEKALNSYCTYDMPGLKAITTVKYWPTLWEGLQKEGNDKGATFLRTFCYRAFHADTVKHFSDKSPFDGVTYPFADMRFIASRAARNGEDEDEVACTASFIKEKKGWKYIDILCGADRVSYP